MKPGRSIGISNDIVIFQPEMGMKSASCIVKSANAGNVKAAAAVYSGGKLVGISNKNLELTAGTGKYDIEIPEAGEYDTVKIFIYNNYNMLEPRAYVTAAYN